MDGQPTSSLPRFLGARGHGIGSHAYTIAGPLQISAPKVVLGNFGQIFRRSICTILLSRSWLRLHWDRVDFSRNGDAAIIVREPASWVDDFHTAARYTTIVTGARADH